MVAKGWGTLDASYQHNFEYFATLALSPDRFKGIKHLILKGCERYVFRQKSSPIFLFSSLTINPHAFFCNLG
jgi:hypothetical protein